MKVKLTCFQLGGVHDSPLPAQVLFSNFSKVFCGGGDINSCATHWGGGAWEDAHAICREPLSFQSRSWPPESENNPTTRNEVFALFHWPHRCHQEMFKTQGRQMTWAKQRQQCKWICWNGINFSWRTELYEVIYLNPQCLLKHHENSMEKKVRCSGAACPCAPLYQLCVGQLYLILIDNLLPSSKNSILNFGHTNRLVLGTNKLPRKEPLPPTVPSSGSRL